MDVALWVTLALVVANLLLMSWVALRRRDAGVAADQFDAMRDASERLERELREEVARSAQHTRVELGKILGVFQQTLLAQSGDVARIDRSLADMKERFSGTAYAQQAGLLAARAYYDKGNVDASRAALNWVAEKASDEGYQAIARLRLAGLLLEKKAYDEALQQVSGSSFPKGFMALAADRRGDIFAAQGKKAEAKAEYEKAYKELDERAEYRRLVEVKLNALGVDPAAQAKSATEASNSEVKK